MKTSSRGVRLLALTLAAGASLSSARGATLVTGSAVIDFDSTSWSSLAGGAAVPGFEALVLDEVFDQAEATARTAAQILSDEVEASPSYTGHVFAMNGTTVTNLAGRTAQPTTFGFDPGALTGHTGAIGLGGVTRWAINPALGGGSVVAGDFTLAYDATRSLVGGSGWAITNNILPASVVFDLSNVTTSASGGTLTISGDLSLSYEVANFLLSTPANQGLDMGDFTFTGTFVPEPSSAALVGLAVAGGVARRRRSRAG